MMNVEQLKKAADSLAVSSAFRYGDPSTFSVTLLKHEIELPGPSDPEQYLGLLKRKLQIEVEEGSAVAVVGAGNGGLLSELMSAGASKALGIEPRRRFRDGLDQVCALLRQVHEGDVVLTHMGWPKAGGDLGPFDLVLWPEGLDECTTPEAMLETMLGLLAPGGCLVVEVTHGDNTLTSGTVNSFRPTESAWSEMLERMGLQASSTPGRLARRVLYKLCPDTAEAEAKVRQAEEARLRASLKADEEAKAKAKAEAEAKAKAEAETVETPPSPPPPASTPDADELPVERTVTTKKARMTKKTTKQSKQDPAADGE